MALFQSGSNGRPASGGRRMRAEQAPMTLRERFGALRNLPPLFRLVWQTSAPLSASHHALRLVRALLPLAMLSVGKLVFDEASREHGAGLECVRRGVWLACGALDRLLLLLLVEFGLAVLTDLLGRAVALTDSLLGDLFTNATSVRLMEHAATLDLEDFEDADFYDRLER